MNAHSIKVTCLGDIAPIEPAESALLADAGSQKNCFENLLAPSDIVVGNLEAPLTSAAKPMEDKKYILKANFRVLDAFPDKFVFSIANNHILDYGHDGLFETIAHLSEKGFRFTGAGKNLEAAGKPVIIDCKGRKIGFLGAADNRYQAATKNEPGTFPADPSLLRAKISQLGATADIVYVSIHMGMEYIPIPAPGMFKLAKTCHQAGAHVVFFHHAHCVSGHTVSYHGATLWGTGNFLFPDILDRPFQPWFETAAWTVCHQIPENSMHIIVEPLILSRNGLPRKAKGQTGGEILKRIDYLCGKINKTEHLGWERLINICKPRYLKLLISNYSDMARRKGLKHMAGQILSSIAVLFLKKA